MALRQHEGLGEAAFVVDRGQIETAVVAIVPAAGEDNPVGVEVPVMITVGLGAVNLRQFTGLAGLKV